MLLLHVHVSLDAQPVMSDLIRAKMVTPLCLSLSYMHLHPQYISVKKTTWNEFMWGQE